MGHSIFWKPAKSQISLPKEWKRNQHSLKMSNLQLSHRFCQLHFLEEWYQWLGTFLANNKECCIWKQVTLWKVEEEESWQQSNGRISIAWISWTQCRTRNSQHKALPKWKSKWRTQSKHCWYLCCKYLTNRSLLGLSVGVASFHKCHKCFTAWRFSQWIAMRLHYLELWFLWL